MRTKFLVGDINWLDYGGTWITTKLNNGDWDYWLVMELVNLKDATGDETQYTYRVTVSAVSPKAAGKENVERACECYDTTVEKMKEYGEERIVEALYSYGVHAGLFSKEGNNAHALLKEAREQLNVITGLFGFFMDKPYNQLGHNGWDFIEGDLSINKVIPKEEETNG